MRRFYVTFLGLLLLASLASMELLSTGARLRGGSDGWTEITVATVSFFVLGTTSVLLLYSLLALQSHGRKGTQCGGDER
jgi:hypothetical protein